MRENKRNLTIAGIVFLVAALVVAILQLVLYRLYYDPDAGLWEIGAPSFAVGWVYCLFALCLLLSLAFGCTVILLYRSKKALPAEEKAPTTVGRVFAGLVLLTLLTIFVAQLVALGGDDHLALILQSGNAAYYARDTACFHIISMILLLPAAFWFLPPLIGKKRSVGAGCFYLLFLAAVVFRLYFDMTLHLNNPRRMIDILALIAAMLASCGEISRLIRPDSYRAFAFATPAAIILCGAAGFSGVIWNLTGFFADGVSASYALFELCLALYYAHRLYGLTDSRPAETPAVPAAPAAASFAAISTEPALTGEQAAEETPADIMPAKESIVEESLPNDPSAENSPVEESLANDPSVEKSPVEESLTNDPSVENFTAEESLTNDPSTENSTVDESLANDPPVENSPAEESLTNDPPAPLSPEEIKAFYHAVCALLAAKIGESEPYSDFLREKARAMVGNILENNDPIAAAEEVRTFLSRNH